MSTPTEYQLGLVQGRREAVEEMARLLRQRLSQWRKADEPGGFRARCAAALNWPVVDLWMSRVSRFAEDELEALAQNLRAQEQQLRASLEASRGPRPWWRRR